MNSHQANEDVTRMHSHKVAEFCAPRAVFWRMVCRHFMIPHLLVAGSVVAIGLAVAAPVADPIEPLEFGMNVLCLWFLGSSTVALLPLHFRRYVRRTCCGQEEVVVAWSSRDTARTIAGFFLLVCLTGFVGVLATVAVEVLSDPAAFWQLLQAYHKDALPRIVFVYPLFVSCLWACLWTGLAGRLALGFVWGVLLVCDVLTLVATQGCISGCVVLLMVNACVGCLGYCSVARSYQVLDRSHLSPVEDTSR